MSLWRQLSRGVRVLVNRRAADRDVADELNQYLEEATDAWRARGLSPEDARRAARVEIGSPAAVRQQVREHGWEHALDSLLVDLRHSLRRLRRNPGFSAVCVLTLALGIGATTAIFGAVNPILVQPLPYPDANRITTIWDRGRDGQPQAVTFGTYREVVERSRSFDALAVMRVWQPALSGGPAPERLDGQRVSAQYLRVLGVGPAIGRDFSAEDDRVNGPRVAIISHDLWQRRFAGDAAIVGRDIMLDDMPFTVIGIMPAAFENVLSPDADVWAPLQYDLSLPASGREWGHHLRMIARWSGARRPGGATVEASVRELDEIARSRVPQFARPAWAAIANGFIVTSLQDDVTRAVRPALAAVIAAVLLVLAIACVNVTNLLLARGAARSAELATLAALGASRMRLVRSLVVESLVLAIAGGALGLLVADAGVRALVALSPPGLPRVQAIAVDDQVFLFALIVTTMIGLLVGLIPAWQASRGDVHARRQGSVSRTVTGHHAMRRALVVAEVALAVVVLVGAGLLLRSLQQLFAIDPGFQSRQVLTLQVHVSGRRFAEAGVTHRFFADALDAVRRVPGVATAALTSQLPLSGDADSYGVHFESSTAPPTEADAGAFRYAVSPGYFDALGIPITRGRPLNDGDRAGVPWALVINESFARRRFPGQDPVGQRLRVGPDSGPWFTIVGVAGDVRQVSLSLTQTDAVYMTPEQWRFADQAMWMVVRARGDAAALTPVIRDAIWSVDKDRPIVRVATMDERLSASAGERRFALLLFQAFALAALALAAIGIYGLLSGSVTERTREIGVRTALGASRGSILTMIMAQGLRLSALGVVLGLAGGVMVSQALSTMLFGISRLDAITHLGVVLVMLSVAAVACGLPARRAARVDPALTLRAE